MSGQFMGKTFQRDRFSEFWTTVLLPKKIEQPSFSQAVNFTQEMNSLLLAISLVGP